MLGSDFAKAVGEWVGQRLWPKAVWAAVAKRLRLAKEMPCFWRGVEEVGCLKSGVAVAFRLIVFVAIAEKERFDGLKCRFIRRGGP